MNSTCKVQVYLPDGTKAPIILATKTNTIREILFNIDFQSDLEYVIFTSTPKDIYSTPIINVDMSLEKLNMWFSDNDYTADFTIYNKSETNNYNKERYEQYMGMNISE
jgi:hypothetical protein